MVSLSVPCNKISDWSAWGFLCWRMDLKEEATVQRLLFLGVSVCSRQAFGKNSRGEETRASRLAAKKSLLTEGGQSRAGSKPREVSLD